MESVLERLKKKELEIKEKTNKSIFLKIEETSNRKIYHTKIVMDFYAFGVDKKKKNRFFITLRELLNQERVKSFNLFLVGDDDKFLGIYYGYRKPIQNVIRRYEDNGVIKKHTFSKVYYIEFKFKKGSVRCYIKGISRLLKKDKIDTKYYSSLITTLLTLEKEVYEFYNKKLPEGGIITKWIEKNLK
ncbi:DUF226 domain-containing protein [Borrelia turicatae]|uniref:DUF226 domain-containing protein n=1 Tax=Borrelia turicatae TaxID=142 RepID=UPI001FF2D039|nr:DUF226 domain-containing protein [Borrelia turicatae]UPA15678.1 DUF226 domain-containing protein [Borrelia turicatae]